MMQEVCRWFLYFYFYAFVGWACEVVYCSIGNRKLVNRGFLHECVCPIYGFGAVCILALLLPLSDKPILLFILGVLLTSMLEYLTSFVMEKLFKMRWWDYSKHKFNINGRVCLLNSTLFGIMVMALVYLVHPPVERLVAAIPEPWYYIVSAVLFVGIMTDTVFSVLRTVNLTKVIGKAKEVLDEKNDELRARLEGAKSDLKRMVDEKLTDREEYAALKRECADLERARFKQEVAFVRFLKGHEHFVSRFPSLEARFKGVSLGELKQKLSEKLGGGR